jgi:hypothetical protein
MHRNQLQSYSTTLSAIASSADGTFRPSASAVLRLIDVYTNADPKRTILKCLIQGSFEIAVQEIFAGITAIEK